jgi:hypothetical protein
VDAQQRSRACFHSVPLLSLADLVDPRRLDRHNETLGGDMPIECGSETKQTATSTSKAPLDPANNARDLARHLCYQSCEEESCVKDQCLYRQTKMTGTTTYDPKTKEWSSTQTSSGKCSCEKSTKATCKMEIEQTVVYFDAKGEVAAHKARMIARQAAQKECEFRECPKRAAAESKCVYQEISIEGETKLDSATGMQVSTQKTIGECKCRTRRWL